MTICFCKRSRSYKRAGCLQRGLFPTTICFCKRTRSYERAGLLQRGRLPANFFFAIDPARPEGPVFRKKDSWCRQFFLQKIQIIGKGRSVAKRTVAKDNFFCKRSRSEEKPSLLQRQWLPMTIFLQKIQIIGKGRSVAKRMVANDYCFCKRSK